MPARKTPDDPDARLSIEAIMADANKKEPGLLVYGAEIDPFIPRITSGLPGLDIALGGGWPANQWNEIVGNPSSGKTTSVLRTVAINQAIDPHWKCLWVASEYFVPDWAEAFGIDLSRVIVMDTNVMEDVYNIIVKAQKNRAVDCVVIDSYPALVSHAEDDQLMEEFAVGIGARQTGKFLRKSNNAQKRSMLAEVIDRPCTYFLINQWRSKIGVLYGDPRVTPGGQAKDYQCFTRVEVRKDEDLWAGVKKSGTRVGLRIETKVIKNKTAAPYRSAVQDFYFTPFEDMSRAQFDIPEQVFSMALRDEVIEKRGGWYYHDDERLGQGREAVVDRLRDDAPTMVAVHKSLWHLHLPHLDAMPLPGWSDRLAPEPSRNGRRKVTR